MLPGITPPLSSSIKDAAVYIGAGSPSAVTGAATNALSIGGFPDTGTAAGDLCILVITSDASKTLGTPAGWTQALAYPSGTQSLWVYWRYYVSSIISATSFTNTSGNYGWSSYAFRGDTLAVPIVGTPSGGSGTAFSALGISVDPNATAMIVAASDANAFTATHANSGFTSLGGRASGVTRTGAFTNIITAGGAVPNYAATITSSSWASAMIAIL